MSYFEEHTARYQTFFGKFTLLTIQLRFLLKNHAEHHFKKLASVKQFQITLEIIFGAPAPSYSKLFTGLNEESIF